MNCCIAIELKTSYLTRLYSNVQETFETNLNKPLFIISWKKKHPTHPTEAYHYTSV